LLPARAASRARGFAALVFALLGALASLVPVLPGQEPAGTIHGRVFSVAPNGEQYAIPGADVALAPSPTEADSAPAAGAEPRRGSTDAEGRFEFTGVPPACYLVTASSAGLAGRARRVCLLAPGGEVELDLEMTLAEVHQSVDVTATVEGLDTIESSATATVEESTLRDAPMINERFEDTLPLLPGVVRGPDGLINLKGARTTQSGSLVNSANVTDPVTGSSAINLPVDVVSEVKVLSNPYDAEYGKFAGAVSEVQTQVSQFDQIHFQLQNFMPRLRYRDDSIVGVESATPRLTFTGPVVPGKVALTQSLEYRFVRTEVEQAGLPVLERDTKLESFDSFTQFDFQLGARHTAGLSLSLYPQKQDFFGLGAFRPQEATPNIHQRGYLLSLRDTYALQTGSLLESQMNFKTFDADVFPNSSDFYRVGLETAHGGFFNRQARDTFRYEARETFHLHPVQAAGGHLLKFGFSFVRNRYDGRQRFDDVDILGRAGRLVQRVVFGPPANVASRQNEYTAFAQNKWSVAPGLSLDLGLRFDHDSITGEDNPAPRAGFAYVLTSDNRTVLRGGAGLFYDRVNLNVPTFPALPPRTEIRFGPGGEITQAVAYRHRFGGRLRNPRSFSWSLQLDRELAEGLFVRAGYQQRNTVRNFVLNPEITPAGSYLTLANSGRDRYREFELTALYRMGKRGQLTASYVRSSALGDLNDVNQFLGNAADAVIRPNERSRLAFDAPNRFLFWADLSAPADITVSPVLDVHTGFPYSIVNEQRDFIGPRNRAGRFPRFASFDLQILKRIKLPFVGRKYGARIGVRIFNFFNSFNPRELQNNLASARFGTFLNAKDREFRGKFILEF